MLSACDSGDAYPGSWVNPGGLPEAWIAAGATDLVVSLWSSADAASGGMMLRFYQNLQRGMKKAQALREAMLATRTDFDDPREWSAFILIGGE